MKCSRCDGDILVEHSYSAGRAGTTSRAVCEKCGQRHVIFAVAATEQQLGLSAYELRRELDQRRAEIVLKRLTTSSVPS